MLGFKAQWENLQNQKLDRVEVAVPEWPMDWSQATEKLDFYCNKKQDVPDAQDVSGS